MEKDFSFIIGSPFDREKLICEIYYKGVCIGEISQETEELLFEIYPLENGATLELPLEKFQRALEYGKNHLLN